MAFTWEEFHKKYLMNLIFFLNHYQVNELMGYCPFTKVILILTSQAAEYQKLIKYIVWDIASFTTIRILTCHGIITSCYRNAVQISGHFWRASNDQNYLWYFLCCWPGNMLNKHASCTCFQRYDTQVLSLCWKLCLFCFGYLSRHDTKQWIDQQTWICWTSPGAHFMNDFSIVIQIQWICHFKFTQVVIKWSLWNVAHGPHPSCNEVIAMKFCL